MNYLILLLFSIIITVTSIFELTDRNNCLFEDIMYSILFTLGFIAFLSCVF